MKKGYFYIAVAVVMFTSFEVVLKFIAGQINPVQLTLCRFAIGFVFLLPVALHSLKKRGERLDGGTMAYFALLGLIGIALCMPILQMAVSYTNSSVAAVMFSCNPVFVTFLAFFMLGEPIKPRHYAALALEVVGTVIIISPWDVKLNMTGVALALLSTLLFSLYGVMGKRKVAKFGGAVVTCFSFLFGSLIVLAFILLSHIPSAAQAFQGAGLDSFANIPVFAGYTLQNLPYVLFVCILPGHGVPAGQRSLPRLLLQARPVAPFGLDGPRGGDIRQHAGRRGPHCGRLPVLHHPGDFGEPPGKGIIFS